MWKTLNRLKTQVGITKEHLNRWEIAGYNANCECAEKQTPRPHWSNGNHERNDRNY